MSQFKTERDSMGEVQVPAEVYYQAQTQRARDNFQFSTRTFPTPTIQAAIDIKSVAAQSNNQLGLLETNIAEAIQQAAEDSKSLNFSLHFPLDVFQTGSGTSTNMNVNEVISTLASDKLGKKVHPNDHVNMGQSSNDVIPAAIQISTVRLLHQLFYPALTALIQRLATLAEQYTDEVKTGRTHLMDAMPMTFGQEIHCWQQQLESAKIRIEQAEQSLHHLPLGGTAVGSGINTDQQFAPICCELLGKMDPIGWQAAPTPALYMSAQEHQLNLMSALKSAAVALLKIANDLRWMNSGPVAGLQEIQLTALQPGSSIMPGKVNPVIAEAVAMIAADIIGNESSVTIAAQSGNFQLNVMLPLIADKLVCSIELLSNACNSLTDKVFNQFSINRQHISQRLNMNPILATALNGAIGYENAAKIAKRADKEGKTVLEIALQETDMDEKTLKAILDPLHLAKPYR